MITTVKLQADGYLVNGSNSVPNAPGNRQYQAVQEWIAEGNTPEPEFTQAELDAQAVESAKQEVSQLNSEAKLAGVWFDGVMCSATAEDMWGLASIKPWIVGGMGTPFVFANGNKIVLTPNNIAAFEAVWTPFRASFFI